jgi:Zn-dependent alcohol dehydrogenase
LGFDSNISGGAIMKARAAIAREANRDLEIDEVELEGPKEGEVLY